MWVVYSCVIHVCVYMYVWVCLSMCVWVHSCVCVYTYMCGCVYLSLCVWCTRVYIHVCVGVLIYVWVCSSVCRLKPKAGDRCLSNTHTLWDRVSWSGACCMSCTEWSVNPWYLPVSIPTCRCWGAPSFHRFWGFKPTPRTCMKSAFFRNHLPGPRLSQT